MRIAVIIPAFKAFRFIEEAVTSVLNQDLDSNIKLQIVIVCDGCEKTFDTARRFGSEDTFVCLTENLGTYKARNLGLSLCRIESDLIANLDADDVWNPKRIEDVINISKNRLNTLSAFACQMNRIDEHSKEIKTMKRKTCPSGAYIYTGKAVKAIGMYRPWWCGSDNEYRNRLYAAGGKLFISPQMLLSYRKHSSQLTSHPDTLRGTKERDFSYDEIERLGKKNYESHFQNHPRQKIFKLAGTILPKPEVFHSYFDSLPITEGD